VARYAASDVEAQLFVTVLGDELLRSRKERGLSRREFIARSGLGITESTLSAYETGTRRMGVHRLWSLCRELPSDPGKLVGAAHRRVVGPAETVYIDLAKLARAGAEQLRPLRAWAAARALEHRGTGVTAFPFHAAALDSMANHCGVTQIELITILIVNEVARF
jgi:transcriptional regulator with XRE-family HTH domain